MQIVNEKDHGSPLRIGFKLVNCVWLGGSRFRRLARGTAGSNSFEEGDFARCVVDLQLELFRF
jgi:hypothetical protein